MNMDLFSYDQDAQASYAEYELGLAMKRQWESDVATVRERGVIPDWIGEPSPLSKDKARLLEYLYDNGYFAWHNYPCKNNRDVTKSIGLQSTGNAKAVIDTCFKEGLIESRLYRGEMVFQLASEGEYALEEWQLDCELGIL